MNETIWVFKEYFIEVAQITIANGKSVVKHRVFVPVSDSKQASKNNEELRHIVGGPINTGQPH